MDENQVPWCGYRHGCFVVFVLMDLAVVVVVVLVVILSCLSILLFSLNLILISDV